MKKIVGEDKIRFAEAGKRRWRKDVNRKKKADGRSARGYGETLKVSAPRIMSFSKNYDKTVEFLDNFRTIALSDRGKYFSTHIDLCDVEFLSVPVAIVLAAEFHRWSLIKKRKLRIIDQHKWNPRVLHILSSLGVFELLKIQDPITQIEVDDNVTLLPLASGLKSDGRKIDRLQAEIVSVLNWFVKYPRLYDGLHEAVENAISHAYPEDYTPTYRYAGFRWWAASCVDLIDEKIRFFVFDQGAGIPYTLPKQGWFEKLRDRMPESVREGLSHEAAMLRIALSERRTETLDQHRGLGLRTMADVVEIQDGSFMRILSGRGEVVCRFGGVVESRSNSRHIGGTLIEWSIPTNAFERVPEVSNDETT